MVAGRPRRAGSGAVGVSGMWLPCPRAGPRDRGLAPPGDPIGLRSGCMRPRSDGSRIEGSTTPIEDGATSAVESPSRSTLPGDPQRTDPRQLRRRVGLALLEADGARHWLVDGRPARHLDGCLDVDFEASAITNAPPVRRIGLPVGAREAAPAAYVRAVGLAAERLEQAYARTADEAPASGMTTPRRLRLRGRPDLRRVRPGARLPGDRCPRRAGTGPEGIVARDSASNTATRPARRAVGGPH